MVFFDDVLDEFRQRSRLPIAIVSLCWGLLERSHHFLDTHLRRGTRLSQ